MRSDKNGYMTISEAMAVLGVTRATVLAWIRTGRLKAKKGIGVGRDAGKTHVSKASLKNAFKAKCRWCGKIFTALHPEKAAFCTVKHKERWFSAKRPKKYPHPGRPRKKK